VFDHWEPVLVSKVCDSRIEGIEGADTPNVGRILVVSTMEPFVPFIQMSYIIYFVLYLGEYLPFHASWLEVAFPSSHGNSPLSYSLKKTGCVDSQNQIILPELRNGSYSHDNDIALARCLDCPLHSRKRVAGITPEAMYHYDGLGNCIIVNIAGYVVHEHAAVPDCQARVVDLRSWDFPKR
jgi:hypothetical protein